MVPRFLLIFFIVIPVYAASQELLGRMPGAYLLPVGQVEATLRHNRVNSTLDVFNLRDLGNAQSDTIGDMSGFGFGINFGAAPNLTLLYDRDFNDFDFGRGTLEVESESLALRRNLRLYPDLAQVLSFQIGFNRNRGSGLNKLFSNVTFNGANFVLNPTRKIEFGGVGDQETVLTLLLSRDIGPRWNATVYGEYARGRIKNGLKTDLPVDELQEVLDILEYTQTRKEAGYVFHYQMDLRQQLSLHYRYLLLYRSKDVSDPIRVNEIVKGRYQIQTDPKRFWFIEGKYSKNQFLGEYSFLYNKRVASRSGRNYGYLSLGHTFKFGYGG